MECSSDFQNNDGPSHLVLPQISTVRHIGITLINGFALPDVASIVEVFQLANSLTEQGEPGATRYQVWLLSASGGRVVSSSSVLVWTESVEALRHADSFRALFIAGGAGTHGTLRDERLITWLRLACPCSEFVHGIDEGGQLLEADFAQSSKGRKHADRIEDAAVQLLGGTHSTSAMSPVRTALHIVQADLGAEIARQITDWVAPPVETQFTASVRKHVSAFVSERIQASARWLEANCDRPISIDDAAQVAAMSERNFLRRFKMEMGQTPTDYILYVRLDMICRLLVETNLPVDKIARRCGIGSGGRLAKLFRMHLATTPTEYRSSKRPSGASSLRVA